jgi:hypothetical protein
MPILVHSLLIDLPANWNVWTNGYQAVKVDVLALEWERQQESARDVSNETKTFSHPVIKTLDLLIY